MSERIISFLICKEINYCIVPVMQGALILILDFNQPKLMVYTIDLYNYSLKCSAHCYSYKILTKLQITKLGFKLLFFVHILTKLFSVICFLHFDSKLKNDYVR